MKKFYKSKRYRKLKRSRVAKRGTKKIAKVVRKVLAKKQEHKRLRQYYSGFLSPWGTTAGQGYTYQGFFQGISQGDNSYLQRAYNSSTAFSGREGNIIHPSKIGFRFLVSAPVRYSPLPDIFGVPVLYNAWLRLLIVTPVPG